MACAAYYSYARHGTLIWSMLLFCKVYLLRLHVQHIILMRGMTPLYEASCFSVKYIYYDCMCSILLLWSILLFCKVYLLRLHGRHVTLMWGMALLYEACCSSVEYIYYDCVCSILLLCEAPYSYMKHMCYSVKYIY